MSKKKESQKMRKIELLDTFVPIFCVSWVLVFTYIALFNESSVFALITVMPFFFLYGFYLIGSAIYVYKELDILKAAGKDTYEVEKRHRTNPPKLSMAKLSVAGGCIVAGILLCILL
ncbi:MAG: hypothetical protein IJ333_08095 [Clostridia bacterium]|nr:hypothetical protein [Clostridia bacterium]